LALLATAGASYAGPLTHALKQARQFDPTFQAAKAEREARMIDSQVTSVAYYPQFQGTYTKLEVETSTRQTYGLTQPLIDAAKYATLQETEPRALFATANFQMREQDLGQRLLAAVVELLKQSESLRLNQSKIEALQGQATSAKKSFELGQGTITDLRDAQVRLDQARADSLMLEALIGAAQRQISAITGSSATLQIRVPQSARAVSVMPVETYLAQGVKANPQVLAAQQNEKIAKINITRADGAMLPVVNAVYTTTSNSLASSNYFGLSVSLPLQAASFYQMRGAAANALKSQEDVRDIEAKTRIEIQRLWAMVNAGLKELPIRLSAIDSAQLSVDANEKSFKGGVRTQIDVLNSIQTLFQVQQDYVTAVLSLADNYLNLLLQAATPLDEAVALVEQALLPPTSTSNP
jgi:protease secretion system outer membrane protein